MQRPWLTRRAFGAALLGCLPACAGISSGRRQATTRVLIGASSGSSYERIARIMARPLESRLPDRRLLLILRPTASGRLMAKELALGPDDGSLIGYPPSGLIYAELLREPGVAYELRRFRWLASATAERRVLLLSSRLGIRGIDDLLRYDRTINVSATAVGSPSWVGPLLINAMLGTRLRPIPGYATPARDAAVLSGEVDGVLSTVSSGGGLLATGAAMAAIRLSRGAPPAELREVPVLGDLAQANRWGRLVDLVEAHDDFGRAVAGPPALGDDILTHLRRAFEATLADPEVVASARRGGLVVSPATGEQVSDRLDALFADASLSGRLADAVACGLERARHGRAC